MKRRRIEVYFPIPVEITREQHIALDKIVSEICKANTPPGHVMWPAESGSKITCPIEMLSDEEPIPFDDDTYFIGCCCREK